jgi:putative nucleotide binding protein
LEGFVHLKVGENPERFVKFFNEAQAINTRLHQFELLPGFGKKHTSAIISAREEKPFESFEDIQERVHNLPDPARAIEKRIFEELTKLQRQNLFIQ